MPVQELITQIITLSVNMSSPAWRRVRIAVSAKEYLEIRAYCFEHDGEFWNRIRDMPLVVERSPLSPPSEVERAFNPSSSSPAAPTNRTDTSDR